MDTYIIHPAPHKKQHRHRTAALLSRHPALCVQIAVAAHSGAETGPTDSWSTNFKRSVKHSLRRAESRLSLFFFFRSVITFKGAMAADWWCCQSRWMYPLLVRHEAQSTVFRMQNREEERGTDSQRPSTSHLLSFLSLILDYYTRLHWAGVPICFMLKRQLQRM